MAVADKCLPECKTNVYISDIKREYILLRSKFLSFHVRPEKYQVWLDVFWAS